MFNNRVLSQWVIRSSDRVQLCVRCSLLALSDIERPPGMSALAQSGRYALFLEPLADQFEIGVEFEVVPPTIFGGTRTCGGQGTTFRF